MNLEQTVQSEFNKIVENGTVETIIAKQLQQTIGNIIEGSLSTYSDFGKNLKETIGQAMQVDLSKISLLGYQQIVVDIVNKVLEENLMTQIQLPLTSIIKDVLSPFERRTYKLSELIEEFKKQEREEDLDEYMTLSIKPSSYGSIYVSIDKKQDVSAYSCEYRFSVDVKTGKIWMFEAKGYRPVSMDITKGSIAGSFDRMLFNLYASQSPIEIDESDCETEWYND